MDLDHFFHVHHQKRVYVEIDLAKELKDTIDI